MNDGGRRRVADATPLLFDHMPTTPEHLKTEAAALAAALGSQYELLQLIGLGGMGRVYLAREPFLDRQVAVKVLPVELADAGDARERFLREARTAARLSHPNIVPLYTFGQAGDLLFFVMGYVHGESLESRLRREGRLPHEDARQILVELAEALDYAHRAGVVHRDLKPDNVLIDAATGRAMLADFGIAKQSAARETLTQTGVLIGTPYYMSPEQAAGDRTLDGRSDLYALGVLGYRMLSGRLPFEGERMQDVLAQHLTRTATPVEHLVPGLPLDLATVVTRALAKDPAERWASGRLMRDALSGDNEESMPDDIRTQAEQGVRMFGITVLLCGLSYAGAIYGFLDPLASGIVAATGFFAPAVSFLSTLRLQRRYGLRVAMNAWLRQPHSWSGWWPRVGRRAGDVWDRLPTPVCAMRRLTTAITAAYVPTLALLLFIARPSFIATAPHWVGLLPVWIVAPLVAGIAYGGWRHRAWARANGLSNVDSARTLSESTSQRSFWSRPDIAALLAPASSGAPRSLVTAGTARNILRELEQLTEHEPSSAHADLYREAVQAGRIACEQIAHCDKALVRLALDADPRERARIQASLDALGERAPDERAVRLEVRDLFQRQLELFREIEARQSQVAARRERLLEQLRMLGRQVAHLRAEAAVDAHDTAEITGRIRALVQGIDARIDGISTVSHLLEHSRRSTPV